MLRRQVRIQLTAFVIIALLGITYVGGKYAGLGSLFSSGGCTVSADFPDSGGIFTGAEVTYRGVGVGKVGELHLIDNGVRVDLTLRSCSHPQIPAAASATVSDLSPVGEQYVNLVPPTGDGPYLKRGAVIPMSRNKIPVATQVLLTNLNSLVSHIDTAKLTTVLQETTAALNNRGPDLNRLLQAGSELITTATAHLQDTIDLIQDSGGVLQTQLDLNAPIASWTNSLDQLTATLKSSDGDIRNLLANGPSDFDVIQNFVKTNSGDLGVLLSNLDTTGQVITAHLNGVEEILELYPAIVAGGLTVANSCNGGNCTAAFGLVTNINDPEDCEAGYGGTSKRTPDQVAPAAPNTSAQCTVASGSTTSVRGAQNVPGGDPVSTAGSSDVLPRAITANTLKVGDKIAIGGSDMTASVLADQSWLTLLTDGLS